MTFLVNYMILNKKGKPFLLALKSSGLKGAINGKEGWYRKGSAGRVGYEPPGVPG